MYPYPSSGWAAESRQTEVLERLLRDREPDLFDSVDLGLLEHVRAWLTREPALANAPDGKGNLLRHAASIGNQELVELLLEYGADPGLEDGEGRTAYELARSAGHPGVARLLI